MKHITLSSLVLIMATQGVLCQDIESKVKKVTFYQNGIFVEREANAQVIKGRNTLTFTKIPVTFEHESLQMSADKEITIMSVSYVQNNRMTSNDSMSIKIEYDSIDVIQKKISLLNIKSKVLNEEEALLRKNQPFYSETNIVSTSILREALDFHSKKLESLFIQKETLKEQTQEWIDKIVKIHERINNIKSAKMNTNFGSVKVEIESDQSSSLTFYMSYFSNRGQWLPSYDLRVKDVLTPINLTMKASLYQSTGEDWNNAKIAVSNGFPSKLSSIPFLEPYILGYTPPAYNYNNGLSGIVSGITSPTVVSGKVVDQQGEPLIGVTVTIKNHHMGTITNLDGTFQINAPVGSNTLIAQYTGYEDAEVYISQSPMKIVLMEGKVLDEVMIVGSRIKKEKNYLNYAVSTGSAIPKTVETTVQYQPTTFLYEIKSPYSIKSDQPPLIVDIIAHQINTLYEHTSIPKKEKAAFLTAKMTDWQEYNLVNGPVSLYLEGKFLGNTALRTENYSDTMDISLGRDYGVIVDRKTIKEFSKKSFFGTNISKDKKFQIVIQNNKNTPINIKILDQVPISRTKDVEVTISNLSGGSINAESKSIEWNQTIQSRQKIELDFGYSVKYPKNMSLKVE